MKLGGTAAASQDSVTLKSQVTELHGRILQHLKDPYHTKLPSAASSVSLSCQCTPQKLEKSTPHLLLWAKKNTVLES